MHYCLQKLHIRPSEYIAMSRAEKALVCASIQLRVDAEAKQAKLLKEGFDHGK